MLEKGTLEVVNLVGPGYSSHLFWVQKATGGWRPIIELSALSHYKTLAPFRMEMVSLVLESIRIGDVMFLIDLKDTCFRFLFFLTSDYTTGLPFQVGFSSSRCSALVWFQQGALTGVTVGLQVRDLTSLVSWWLVGLCRFGPSYVGTLELLLNVCRDLGIVINWEKSDFETTSKAQYLRILIDTIQERIFPKESWINRYWGVADNFSLSTPLWRCGSRPWAAWPLWKGLLVGAEWACGLFSGSWSHVGLWPQTTLQLKCPYCRCACSVSSGGYRRR